MSDEKSPFETSPTGRTTKKFVPIPRVKRPPLFARLDDAYVRQMHYAELEMRVFWYAITAFMEKHPGRCEVLADEVVFQEGAYGEFQEFCKTLGNEQRSAE